MPELTPVAKFGGLVLIAGALVGGYVAWKHGVFGSPAAPAVSTMDVGSQSAPLTPQPVPAAPLAQTAAPPPVVNPASYRPAADALTAITQNCVVRISVENPSEPIYGETSGLPHGFNYDFAKLLFSQPEFTKNCPSGVAVDTRHEVDSYENVPRQLLLSQNGASTVDIAMDGLTFPDNTPGGVIYTNAYLDDFGYALITQKGSNVRRPADLEGKVIGVLQGDPDVKAFVQRRFPGATIKEISDSGTGNFIQKAVDGGDVDAFIYDYPFAVPLVQSTDTQFAASKLDGSDISYKIGVRSGDQNLLFALNSAINRVKQTPQYTDLMRKYFMSNQILAQAASAGERLYAVKGGDTLASIASAQMGSAGKYRAIQKRNNLPNPNLILVGQRLVIPLGS